MRGLLAWEEECARECYALLHNVILQEDISDSWRWLLEPTQGYSVRGTYHFLTAPDEVLVGNGIHNVWHQLVPSKISVFAWRLLCTRIPTKTNLLRRRVLHQNDILCVGGCGCSETVTHLFLDCDIFATTWYFVWRWLGIDFVPSGGIGDHFHQFSKLAGMPRSSHFFSRLIWLACVCAIWK